MTKEEPPPPRTTHIFVNFRRWLPEIVSLTNSQKKPTHVAFALFVCGEINISGFSFSFVFLLHVFNGLASKHNRHAQQSPPLLLLLLSCFVFVFGSYWWRLIYEYNEVYRFAHTLRHTTTTPDTLTLASKAVNQPKHEPAPPPGSISTRTRQLYISPQNRAEVYVSCVIGCGIFISSADCASCLVLAGAMDSKTARCEDVVPQYMKNLRLNLKRNSFVKIKKK